MHTLQRTRVCLAKTVAVGRPRTGTEAEHEGRASKVVPSTIVHVAFAGLLGAALLADEFDWRAALVVLGVAAFPDLDAVVGLWIPGGHRAVLHTLVVPTVAGAALLYDTVVRDRSLIRSRWGAYGRRVAWVSLLVLVVAGIGLDLFTNGVNLLYPFHDQFYRLSGKLVVSNQHGVVQTVFEDVRVGTTDSVHYTTGIDPNRGPDSKTAERTFRLASSGVELLVGATSFLVVAYRVREANRSSTRRPESASNDAE